MEIRAKLFISCGQATRSERELSEDIRERMDRLGFDPYVAIKVQDLRGLREGIFEQLRDMDYFLFVDFCRERIIPHRGNPRLLRKQRPERRGSLFSHQELAIASFLEIDAVLLQEKGVRALDGMMSVFQGNSICFRSRAELPKLVEDTVRERMRTGLWSPSNRRRLQLSAGKPMREVLRTDGQVADFFPIRVENLHHKKTAENAVVFLEKIVQAETSTLLFNRPLEIKWGGSILPSLMIPPGGERPADGFYLLHKDPGTPRFNTVWTDYGGYVPRICQPGVFHCTYCVRSTSFAPAWAEFRVTTGESVEAASFQLADSNHG